MALLKLLATSVALAAVPTTLYFVGVFDPASELVSLQVANEGYNTGTFGNFYSRYFLTTKENNNTQTWKNRDASINSGTSLESDSFFTDAKNKSKEVKAICKEKYAANYSSTDDTKWKEVWTYCSLGGNIPTTIEEAKDKVAPLVGVNEPEKNYTNDSDTASANKLGKQLKTEVISVADPRNNWFWNLRDDDFKNGRITNGDQETFFETKKNEKSLKELCKEAYAKDKADNQVTNDGKLTEAEVKRYCTLPKPTTTST